MTRTMNTLRGTATPKLLLLTLGFLLLAVVIGCGSSSSEEAASPQAPMAPAPAAPAAQWPRCQLSLPRLCSSRKRLDPHRPLLRQKPRHR